MLVVQHEVSLWNECCLVRDGSLLWYKDITDFLMSKLDMVENEPYPCVLATRDRSCAVMIHADDMLIVGRKELVLGKFMDTTRSKYDISTDVLEKPSDEVSFLKRRFLLHEDGSLTIQTHHKHVCFSDVILAGYQW